MASNTVADVYLTLGNSNFKNVAKDMNRARLMHFSDLAAVQLKNGTPGNPCLPKNAVTLPKGAADERAAARVTTWIATNDMKSPKQLTLAGLNLEHFDTIVYTYATAYAFRLKRELRGDDLRNAIYDYMHQGILTHDEFAMIVEWLAFDGGLVKTAMHEIMFRKCKGGVHMPPDMGKIEAYCKAVGMWKQMEEVGKEIGAKMEEKDRRDAERMAKRGGRFEGGWPELG